MIPSIQYYVMLTSPLQMELLRLRTASSYAGVEQLRQELFTF